MCITVFFNFVIAAGDDGEDWVSLLIYFGNGMQYMIRYFKKKSYTRKSNLVHGDCVRTK